MDTAVAAVVRATGASGALLYVLTPGREALWLSHVSGVPREVAAPWSRVAMGDPMPVADAVREERLVWVNGQVEMARRYPRPAVVLPYDFALAAVPVASDSGVRGGLVLFWPSGHPPQLSRVEHDALRTGSRHLGHLMEQAVRRGEPVVSPAGRASCRRNRDAPHGRGGLGGHRAPRPAARRVRRPEPERPDHPRHPGRRRTRGRRTGAAAGLPAVGGAAVDGRPHVEDRYRAALISRTPQTFRVLRPPDTWLSFELYPDPSGISVRIDRAADGREPDPVSETAHGPGRATVLYHLMHLATTLTEAVGVQDVVDQTAQQLLPALGAQGMVLMTSEDGRLRILGHRGYSTELLGRFDGAPLSRDIPGAAVLATGEAGFFPSFRQMVTAYPKMTHEDGMAAWAVLPLIASSRPIGSVLLSYDRPRAFPPSERAVLTSLAGLVGQALDRALLYDSKDRLAHRLQSALLPTACPPSPGCGSSPAICRPPAAWASAATSTT